MRQFLHGIFGRGKPSPLHFVYLLIEFAINNGTKKFSRPIIVIRFYVFYRPGMLLIVA